MNTKSEFEVEVRVGLHHLDDKNLDDKTYEVEKIFLHDFSSPSLPGDIAVLKLSQPLEFIEAQVEPACLNTEFKDAYDVLMASGWGTTSISRKDTNTGKLHTGDVSPVLKQAFFYEDKKGCKEYLICIDSDNRDSVCQGKKRAVNAPSPIDRIDSLLFNGFLLS